VDTLNAQSSPPATVVELYADWSREPPTGVVADIASIRKFPDRADPGSPPSRLPSG
jgi:hypothetical protein